MTKIILMIRMVKTIRGVMLMVRKFRVKMITVSMTNFKNDHEDDSDGDHNNDSHDDGDDDSLLDDQDYDEFVGENAKFV